VAEVLLAILDEDGGDLLVDTTDGELAAAMQADLAEQLGEPLALACARPLSVEVPETAPVISQTTAHIYGLWHGSLIEGPGRRSVVGFQGCDVHCPGCNSVDTWNFGRGDEPDYGVAQLEATDVSVEVLAEQLLNPEHARDGVTLIGGEPLAQPEAAAALVKALRERQPDVHITCYSGRTLQALRRRGNAAVDYVLDHIDVLIDGPYVEALHGTGGPWTGSGNQRVIDMPATIATGSVVLWEG
jgi:anaerobic ribonucleoside-triphosphate reductase activating protein